jgi:hypothetical protein
MEKLLYILCGQHADELPLTERINIKKLKQIGCRRIRVCQVDEDVALATHLRRGSLANDVAGLITLWVDSRLLHSRITEYIETLADQVHGYVVSESEPMKNLEVEYSGARTAGMNEVVLMQKPKRQSRSEWLTNWMGNHTDIAIEAQSIFGYRQNLVTDTLTEAALPYDAVVEENFPVEAMTSPEAFYDAEGNPERYHQNAWRMQQSIAKFLDFEMLAVIPTSEYNY